ncbi:MAG TPA: DUF1489 family protein [Sphingomicrobium sp.]|nr:DUF1489 family protein [Sphingomicrobium sp.]
MAMGCRDFDMLAQRVLSRAVGGELRVPTRMRPKRSDELIGGSLYWIVKHRLVGCSAILRIDDREDGRIDIVCSAKLVRIAPVHRRAHQGWRYFESEVASAGHEDGSGVAALPPPLYGRLAALALV